MPGTIRPPIPPVNRELTPIAWYLLHLTLYSITDKDGSDSQASGINQKMAAGGGPIEQELHGTGSGG
jgi:hypothetical protein